MEEGDFKALIDPFISDNAHALKTSDIKDITHIFVTHGHGDLWEYDLHCKNNNANVITNFEISNYLSQHGIAYQCISAAGQNLNLNRKDDSCSARLRN